MIAPLPGLLLDVQRRLEALYALDTQAPVTDFVLSEEEAAAYPGGGSRTLVTQEGDLVALGVVLERDTFALLAGADPRVRLDQGNLGAFCTLTGRSATSSTCTSARAPRAPSPSSSWSCRPRWTST